MNHEHLSDRQVDRRKRNWRQAGYLTHIAFQAAAITVFALGIAEFQTAFWVAFASLIAIAILMLVAIQRMARWGDIADERQEYRMAQHCRQKNYNRSNE